MAPLQSGLGEGLASFAGDPAQPAITAMGGKASDVLQMVWRPASGPPPARQRRVAAMGRKALNLVNSDPSWWSGYALRVTARLEVSIAAED